MEVRKERYMESEEENKGDIHKTREVTAETTRKIRKNSAVPAEREESIGEGLANVTKEEDLARWKRYREAEQRARDLSLIFTVERERERRREERRKRRRQHTSAVIVK